MSRHKSASNLRFRISGLRWAFVQFQISPFPCGLVTRCNRHKLLDSFVLLNFSGVDVPLRIHCDCVDPVKLAGVGAVATESSECFACVAIEDPHLVVRSVGYVEVLLLRVTREGEFVGCAARGKLFVIQTSTDLAAGRSIRRYIKLFDELPLFREHFNPVLAALADINETVLRELDEMQIWNEIPFLWRRTASPLVSGNWVIGDLA